MHFELADIASLLCVELSFEQTEVHMGVCACDQVSGGGQRLVIADAFEE